MAAAANNRFRTDSKFFENEYMKLRNEFAHLQGISRVRETDIQELSTKVNDLQETIRTLECQIQDFSKKYERLQKDSKAALERKERELEKRSQRCHELQQESFQYRASKEMQINKLTETVENLEGKLTETNRVLNIAKATNLRVDAENSELKKEIEDLIKRVQAIDLAHRSIIHERTPEEQHEIDNRENVNPASVNILSMR